MFHAGHRRPDLAGELRPRKAAQTVEDLESKLDEAKTTVKAQEKRLADAQSAHQAQAVVLAQIRERLMLNEEAARTATEDHAAELARLNASIEAERGRYQQQSEQTRADMAEQRKLAQEATSERDQARAELATVKAKAEAAEQTYQEHRKAAAQEAHRVAERMTKAVSDRDEARKEASSAREDAAKLRGQVEALQTQANDLMRTLVARQPPEENDHPL